MPVQAHTPGPGPFRQPLPTIRGGILTYENGSPPRVKERLESGVDPRNVSPVKWPDAGITLSGRLIMEKPEEGWADLELVCRVEPGRYRKGAFIFRITFGNWRGDTYVLLPGAVYNGNRFESRRIPYSPKLKDPGDISPAVGPIITDIPRLNNRPGPSHLHIPAGIMALPVAGFYFPEQKAGWLVQFDPVSSRGIRGIMVEEDLPDSQGSLVIQAPLVRAPFRYRIADSQWLSEDIPEDLGAGAEERLTLRLFHFHSPSVQGLFDQVYRLRQNVTAPLRITPWYPYREVFRMIEKKYNRENWVESPGYYSVGMRENFLQDWQIGWTGGMIATLPLLALGTETSVNRVQTQFDWLFPDGISPSGFFWDSGEQGIRWYGGDIRKPHTRNWHLIRKSADGLYYILKQFLLMDRKGIRIKPEWETGTRQVAAAFERLWGQYGQLGQFVHSLTGDVVVGGSTSGAIVPAALMLMADRFREARYRHLASEIGEYYYGEFVRRGVTQGGPGDALQCPDSESAYAMTESFIRLYEGTGAPIWLERAGEMARQFSTWIYGWEFPFPAGSASGKLGNTSRGAVMANVQNVHPAPGICSYSGLALLKLTHYTGDAGYARLLEEITLQIPQNLSHPDRPVPGLRDGWISERINTSDWLEGIGEIMEGSTWSEVSAMLTASEIPSVYLNKMNGNLFTFDHLEATVEKDPDEGHPLFLQIRNPTQYLACARLYVTGQSHPASVLKEGFLLDVPPRIIEPGETIRIPC